MTSIAYLCVKDSRLEQTKLPMSMASSNDATNEISGNQSKGGNGTKLVTSDFTRIKTMTRFLEESQIICRENEKYDMIKLVSNQFSEEVLVISVWGMGGLGKTMLIKDVYRSQNLIDMFEKHAFVTVLHPFNLNELLKSLIMQLNVATSEKNGSTGALIQELAKHLEGKKCLIVVDDLSTTAEWKMIKNCLPKLGKKSRIVVTTREESIAKHCSGEQENIYRLKFLEHALDLFRKRYI
jgi:Ni2+-binding GTPase involved in maturation of urease and hydrogenase